MPEPSPRAELGSALLLENTLWFIRVRWAIAGVLAVAGTVTALFPGWLGALGLDVAHVWLWGLAAGLTAANAAFGLVLRRLRQKSARPAVIAFLRCQIAVDLVIVTLLVHVIGSTRTFIPFVYLFHIAMACIFFPRKESFLVTLGAAILYFLTVLGEVEGAWPSMGVFSEDAFIPPVRSSLALLVAGSAIFIWWVVWYFVSTLSEAVRRRDLQLSAANEQLVRIDQEKNRQMLTTVHELKVPFAGIESNIEVLKVQHGAMITPAMAAILERIDLRAQLLRERINQILFLGNLKSRDASAELPGPVDIAPLIEGVVQNLAPKARERQVQVQLRLPSIMVSGNVEQLAALFTNLVANAVSYSNVGGAVEISAREERDEVRVLVADHGIGIRDEALPHIFDEFYRTKEAARINQMSTGLGLAIVKEIARQFGLRIKVTTELNQGTTFDVAMPKPKDSG
jgi:two-component system phosphate regulon sensor histidine kinase PhoR